MVSTYDKALNRLKTRRADNPEYAMMSRQLATMSTELNKEQQSINSRIGYTGNSLSAQVGAMLKTNASIGDIYGKVFNEASANRDQRLQQIDQQIENVTIQRDAAKEAEQKAEKAKKQGMWKAGISAGLTLLGTAIPGVGTAIGSAVGNLIAGSGVLDSVTGGADPEMLMSAASDIGSAMTTIQSNKVNKQVTGDIAEFMKPGGGFSALDDSQKDMLSSSLLTKNFDLAYSLMGKDRPKANMWSSLFKRDQAQAQAQTPEYMRNMGYGYQEIYP